MLLYTPVSRPPVLSSTPMAIPSRARPSAVDGLSTRQEATDRRAMRFQRSRFGPRSRRSSRTVPPPGQVLEERVPRALPRLILRQPQGGTAIETRGQHSLGSGNRRDGIGESGSRYRLAAILTADVVGHSQFQWRSTRMGGLRKSRCAGSVLAPDSLTRRRSQVARRDAKAARAARP